MKKQFAIGYVDKKYVYGEKSKVDKIILPLMKPVKNIYADGNTFLRYMPTFEEMQEYIADKMEFLQGEKVSFQQV